MENPPLRSLEHHVGTWMGTVLKKVFADEKWAITPEQTDNSTKRRPDFVIEWVKGGNLVPHCYVELKKVGGERFEAALQQTIKSLAETVEDLGYVPASFSQDSASSSSYQDSASSTQTEVFVVVMRGFHIGFFEYHLDADELDDRDIHNFNGCVSLTQPSVSGKEIIPGRLPLSVKKVYFDAEKLRGVNDAEVQQFREDASEYQTPCVFDIREKEHEKWINGYLHHIATKKARSS